MSEKLRDERSKSHNLLKFPSPFSSKHQNTNTINLSDLKEDKTLYLDNTPNKVSNFEPEEMTARSTMFRGASKAAENNFFDHGLDEILMNSRSAVVRNKYRESLGSSTPRTADMSLLSSTNTSNTGRMSQNGNFCWDSFKCEMESSRPNNFGSIMEDEFVPAEDMAQQLMDDEKEHQNEHRAMPKDQTQSQESMWDQNRSSYATPNFSFGQSIGDIGSEIRKIFPQLSPQKRTNRVPMVDITVNGNTRNPMDKSSVQILTVPVDEKFHQKFHQNMTAKEMESIIKDNDSLMSSVPRGQKRRSTSVCGDPIIEKETPKSALDKNARSRSPNSVKELEALAAARLVPKYPTRHLNHTAVPSSRTEKSKDYSCSIGISPHREGRFKKPQAYVNVDESSFEDQEVKSAFSREYVTAMECLTIKSPMSAGKMSLPNYTLRRNELGFTSPPSTGNSAKALWSPPTNDAAQLKRTVSQCSNGSEFSGNYLPLKITHQCLSWESIKLRKCVNKSLNIQNTAMKKLNLLVYVEGPGFQLTTQELRSGRISLTRQEVRKIEIEFMPTVVGPAKGALILETSCGFSRSIPLFAYGGHASLKIQGIMQGPFGPAFLTMGSIQELTGILEQYLEVKNSGSLPGFATLTLEKTNLNEFFDPKSFSIDPMQLLVEPGKIRRFKITYTPRKPDIRMICNANKDVVTIGQVCMIAGDEVTRLRILKNIDVAEPRLVKYIPKTFPNEQRILSTLANFNEKLNRSGIQGITKEIRTSEFALTVNRSMDETHGNLMEFSLTDDTQMPFETFMDQNDNYSKFESSQQAIEEEVESIESRFFRVTPSELIFSRYKDDLKKPKTIVLQSISRHEKIYLEVLPSHKEMFTSNRNCGCIEPGQSVEIKVNVISFPKPFTGNYYVEIFLKNDKISVPVKFVS
ncbi:unnamed protein product [Diamesa serratosioi]